MKAVQPLGLPRRAGDPTHIIGANGTDNTLQHGQANRRFTAVADRLTWSGCPENVNGPQRALRFLHTPARSTLLSFNQTYLGREDASVLLGTICEQSQHCSTAAGQQGC